MKSNIHFAADTGIIPNGHCRLPLRNSPGWAASLIQTSTAVFVAICLLSLVAPTPVSAATVPPGFTETAIAGPWTDAVGTFFESNGRTYVWERTGKVWFQDPGDTSFTLLLNISDEVGT